MKIILFFLLPLYGHVYPNLKIIKKLKDAGYHVICMCSPNHADLIEPYQVDMLYYDQEMLKVYETKSEKKLCEHKYSYYLSYFNIENVEWNFVQLMHLYIHIMKCIEKSVSCRPDIILYDSAADWGLIYAKKYGIKSYCVESATEIKYTNHLFQKFYKSIVMTEIEQDRELGLCKQNDLESLLPFEEYKKVIMYLNSKLDSRKCQLANISALDQFCPDATFVHLTENFYKLFANEYKNKIYCGFSLDHKIDKSTKKGIFITRGTSLNRHESQILKYMIEGVKNLQEKVVATTGGYSLDDFQYLNSGTITVNQFTNQNQLLRDSKLLICHGGITGVREAIMNETPCILYPSNFHDYQVACAVEQLGIGIVLKNRELSKGNTEELKWAVDEVLADNYQKYINNVRAVKEDFINVYQNFSIIKKLKERDV